MTRPAAPKSPASKPVALITGASRGLGAAVAEALAPTYHIVAIARTVGALEELDDRISAAGGKATLAPIDITEEDALKHICRAIYDRWGSLALLVHAAIHAPPLAPAGHIDAKDWAQTIATNITATGRLIANTEPLLRVGDGTAVFFDDPCAGKKFFGAYGASKAAQLALAQSWRAENARIGPRILIHRPNPMPTATRARFYPGEDRSALATPADEAQRLLAALAGESAPGQGGPQAPATGGAKRP